MSLAGLNGLTVLSCRLSLPFWGVWTAEVEVDAAEAPTGSAALEFDGPGGESIKFLGTIIDSGPWQGRSKAYVVGGAGKLREVLSARNYDSEVPAHLPVLDVLLEAGEAADPSIRAALAGVTLPAWIRATGKASRQLAEIAEKTGRAWRVKPDGTVWFGLDAWLPYTANAVVQDDDGAWSKASIAPDAPTLLPGMVFEARRVVGVVYTLEGGLRAEVSFGQGVAATQGRERDWLRAAVLSVIPELAYLKEYDGTVLLQAEDGTLGVVCDDAAIGQLTNVKIRGLYGTRLVVAPGARCRVAFAGGDARLPFVAEFDASAEASKAIARVDDEVDMGVLTAAAGATPVTFTWTKPGALAPEVPTTTLAFTPGKIATGNGKVLA